MKYFFKVAGLILLIVLSFSYIIPFELSKGSVNSDFNKKYRMALAHSPTLRTIFGLHIDGDGRFDYLGSKSGRIQVEIDSMEGLDFSYSSQKLLGEKIKAVTGKEVVFIDSDRNIPYQTHVSEDLMQEIIDQYQSYDQTMSPYIYLLVLSSSGADPDVLGYTYEENGIILFTDVIENLTQFNRDVFPTYMGSTALHEFGHQLGLKHNDIHGCLMNPAAEKKEVAWQSAADVITDFCDYEKGLIRAQ